MKFIFVLLTVAVFCNAHTVITGFIANGASTMDCVRPLYPGSLYSQTFMGSEWPIQSSNFLANGVNSNNYTCGFLPFAAEPAKSKCTVAAGSQVGVSYYHGAYGTEDPVLDAYIARSHKGPFIVYMAKSDTGAGKVWFKIYESGKLTDTAANYQDVKWAVPDTLLAGAGTMKFTIPSDIAAGNYLLRTEIIALHDTSPSGAQPYVHCSELTVTGGGSANPLGIAIPGDIKTSDPGFSTQYSIYNQFNSPYPIPGPDVYVAGSLTQQPTTTAATTTTTTAATTSTQTPATTSDVPVPKIDVAITAQLQMAPKDVDIPEFIYEVTQALSIPAEAIAAINVDLDLSTDTTTVIHFTIENVINPATYQRVDPIATAYALKTMAENNDPKLTSKAMLSNMAVLSVDESAASQSQGFVGSTNFIIMVCAIGGTLIISVAVTVTIFIVRRRRASGFF